MQVRFIVNLSPQAHRSLSQQPCGRPAATPPSQQRAKHLRLWRGGGAPGQHGRQQGVHVSILQDAGIRVPEHRLPPVKADAPALLRQQALVAGRQLRPCRPAGRREVGGAVRLEGGRRQQMNGRLSREQLARMKSKHPLGQPNTAASIATTSQHLCHPPLPPPPLTVGQHGLHVEQAEGGQLKGALVASAQHVKQVAAALAAAAAARA
jgi:hypothetical protein